MDNELAILVTGGSGFIGSHLVEYLLAADRSVVVVDDFSTGQRTNLAEAQSSWGEKLQVIEGRVSDVLPTLDPMAFSQCYHLAAAVGVRLVVEEPIRTIETNVRETSATLEFAENGKVPTLVASTSEVYGKGVRTPFAEDDDVVYGPTIYTRWSYACSKAIDEYLALAYSKQGRVPAVVVRLFNTVGPRQIGEYGMVLPRFVSAVLENRAIEVHGDGSQSRCFCDVRDVVPAMVALLDEPEHHGRVFNVGSNQPMTISALAEFVREELGGESEIRNVPYEEAFSDGFDDLQAREPDLKRVKEAIGFAPRIGLDQTVRDLADSMGRGKVRG